MAAPCTTGDWCTLGWFAVARNRRQRWVAHRKLHTTRNIPVSLLIQRESSGELNCGLSWLSALPLGKLNSATRPNLHPNYITSGVPHRALKDDVYKGMFIPKGSLVIANTRWATEHVSELMSLEPLPQRYVYEWSGISWSVFFQSIPLSLKIERRSRGALAFGTFRLRTKVFLFFNRTYETIIMPNQDMPWQTSRRCQFMACSSYYPQFIWNQEDPGRRWTGDSTQGWNGFRFDKVWDSHILPRKKWRYA